MTLDRHAFVVVNAGEDYAFDIPRADETRITAAFFAQADVEDAWASATMSEAELLDVGPQAPRKPIEFSNAFHSTASNRLPDFAGLRIGGDIWGVGPRGVDDRLSALLAVAIAAETALTRAARNLGVLGRAQREELVRRLSIARTFIEAHAHRDLSLDEAASAACLSKYYFLRRFRELVGLTPLAYHQGLRLQRAAEAISKDQGTLTEIADACGYSELAAFSRAFKRRFGAAPSAFRVERQS